ncbi:hypothetical protein A1O3_06350 [Capronia epimyces CBS 606.96]|uniref:DUF1772 domain-containing protein n=1 Tax=Capronia epimyces CBS 606.96 TaxID=1182542 RepID=W9XPS1_9EURO|nr:uncharacterized protein A1O3_06350 [Capronia epimyces CBS 606.96]EXJ82537.1 hypothetical protein A1O3_06350 [Capronia epimyces CBS 606.96]
MSTTKTLGVGITVAIPLISSSLTVFYALLEPTIFYPFIKESKDDLAASSKAVRLFWTNWLPLGLAGIFSVTLPSIVGGIYAARYFPEGSPKRSLSLAGAAFTLGHFAFVYPISQKIKWACDEEVEKKGQTIEYVKQWLKIHFWRTISTDVPALVCFALVAFGN